MRAVATIEGLGLPSRLTALASLLLLTTAGVTRAAERPKVSVRVEVVERTYRAELTDDERRWVEQEAARALAARLARQFGFLDFDTADSPLRLSVRLEPRDERSFPEVGFRITLSRRTGERLGDPAGVWWPFRPPEAFGMQSIASKEDFEREIELKLDSVDYAQLMRATLNAVIIASDAELVKDAGFVGWRIPYLRRELCMDRDSVLVVESVVPILPVGPTELAFRARALRLSGAPGVDPLDLPVMGEAEPGQLHLEALVSAPHDAIRVQGVRVVEYRRLSSDARCGAPVGPADVSFGDERGNP